MVEQGDTKRDILTIVLSYLRGILLGLSDVGHSVIGVDSEKGLQVTPPLTEETDFH